MPSLVRKALRAYWHWTITGSPLRLLVGVGVPPLLLAILVVLGDDETRQQLQNRLSGGSPVFRLKPNVV